MAHLACVILLAKCLFQVSSGTSYSNTNANLVSVPSIPDTVDVIILDNNLITAVSASDFENLISLTELSLDYNKVTKFPDLGNKKSTVVKIGLDHNDLQSIPHEYLVGLDSLVDLRIMDNPKLGVLPDVSFISTLKLFYFSGCGLTSLNKEYFPTDIAAVAVSQNSFSSFSFTRDLPSKELTRININTIPNVLHVTTRNDLINFTKLDYYMSMTCEVEKVPDFFGSKETIKTINLRNNKIQTIGFPEVEFMLGPLTSGKRKINLSKNLLKSFPCFADIKNHTEELELTDNLLECDCRLKDLLQAVQESGNTFPKVDLYPCVSPPHLTTFSWDDLQLQDITCRARDGSGPLYRAELQGENLKIGGPYLMTKHNSTVLGCFRTCHLNKYCWRFNFDNKTGRCELIGHSGCVRLRAEGVDTYELQ